MAGSRVSIYTVAVVVVLYLSGRLIELHKHTRIYVGNIFLYTIHRKRTLSTYARATQTDGLMMVSTISPSGYGI